MAYLFEDFKFQWLVDETKLNLPKELDFTIEAENAKKVQELFSQFQWLKVGFQVIHTFGYNYYLNF